jgi:hypothetical protein
LWSRQCVWNTSSTQRIFEKDLSEDGRMKVA